MNKSQNKANNIPKLTMMNKPTFVQENVPLNDKNWFRTGGPARLFAQIKTEKEFQEALAYAKEQQVDLFVLGGGANVLISQDGFDGLVLQPKFTEISHKECDKQHVLVQAGAGVQMPQLISYCLANNIIGLEEFSGIPGTVGGAAYNNMHYFQFSLSDFLFGGRVVDRETGQIYDVDKQWLNLGYDHSKLHEKKQYLLSATFKLKKATDLEIAHARGRNKEMVRHRCARYPTALTCGCFFRNFHPDEVKMTIPGTNKKMIYVAYYLDKIGIKGALTVGDAVVSHQHANMLVNRGNATSDDLIQLARKMQEMVHATFGVLPQTECELVGFKKYPLLTR
ncbi:UDP-N-acetylmuramate dehydrogenase [Candidatus Dependentiae bacterium]